MDDLIPSDSRIIQEQYYISGNLINGYGLTILSKWPCVFTEVRYFTSFLCPAFVISLCPVGHCLSPIGMIR